MSILIDGQLGSIFQTTCRKKPNDAIIDSKMINNKISVGLVVFNLIEDI